MNATRSRRPDVDRAAARRSGFLRALLFMLPIGSFAVSCRAGCPWGVALGVAAVAVLGGFVLPVFERPEWAKGLFLVSAAACLALAIGEQSLPGHYWAFIATLIGPGAGVLASPYLLTAARQTRPHQPQRPMMLAFGLGALAMFLGATVPWPGLSLIVQALLAFAAFRLVTYDVSR